MPRPSLCFIHNAQLDDRSSDCFLEESDLFSDPLARQRLSDFWKIYLSLIDIGSIRPFDLSIFLNLFDRTRRHWDHLTGYMACSICSSEASAWRDHLVLPVVSLDSFPPGLLCQSNFPPANGLHRKIKIYFSPLKIYLIVINNTFSLSLPSPKQLPKTTLSEWTPCSRIAPRTRRRNANLEPRSPTSRSSSSRKSSCSRSI